MNSNKNVANAVGGKTARACDSCIKRRARWYCGADDAFLCQACDSSVHSANPLARRHERVRLKTASVKSTTTIQAVTENKYSNSVPSWHKGFTRKARTPRHGKLKTGKSIRNTVLHLVPEVGSDEISHEENEEDQLLYRVPIFDPFAVELCTSTRSNEAGSRVEHVSGSESKAVVTTGYKGDLDNSLQGSIPSDKELAEFAADVESLLGRGFENESLAMEEFGWVDYKEKDVKECATSLGSKGKVKVEVEEAEEGGVEAAVRVDDQIDLEREPFELNFKENLSDEGVEREPFELNFGYDSPATCGEEDEKVIKGEMPMEVSGEVCEDDGKRKKKMKKLLSLDYESVITAWASQGSPWTTGDRPDFDPDECWPDCMGVSATEVHPHHSYTEFAGIGSYPVMVDGGREARVSRYREKRRTRLFSKKIRYEVRKLNAEKRPRLKGRFVKRASSLAGTPSFPLFNK